MRVRIAVYLRAVAVQHVIVGLQLERLGVARRSFEELTHLEMFISLCFVLFRHLK